MIRLVLLAVLFPAVAGAQQIVSKGSWVLESPDVPVIGDFTSIDQCKNAYKNLNLYSQSIYDQAMQAKEKYYQDPYAAALRADPGERSQVIAEVSAVDNEIVQQIERADEMVTDSQEASCVQQ